MKRLKVVAALVGALCAGLLTACGADPVAVRPTEGRTIASTQVKGKVLDKVTTRGIAGANVRIAYGPGRTVTSADGTFALGPVPQNGGAVIVTAEGYATRTVELDARAIRTGMQIELSRASQTVAYSHTVNLQPGRIDGTGRVALSGDRIIATGREGKLGALFNLDRVTGQEYDRFSWAALFNPLPMEIADLTAHPSAGTFLLTNSGRVYAFDTKGRYRKSTPVGKGPGAMACDGRLVYIATQGAIHILDTNLNKVDERPFEGGDPSGVALDGMGNLFVSTWEGHIVELDADNRLLADWQVPGAATTGGVAVDADGHVFVTDPSAGRVVVMGSTGRLVGAFGQSDLRSPRGIVVDDQGTVFVGDVSLKTVARFDRIPGTTGLGGTTLP